MRTTRRIAGMVTAALVLAGGTALWAGGRQKESPTHPSLPKPTRLVNMGEADILKGLKGVHVAVLELGPEALKIGLTDVRIQQAAEAVLRRNGVRVLTREAMMDTRGTPFLSVSVNVFGGAFNVDARLNEAVRLERSPTTMMIGAMVWGLFGGGTHGGNTDYVVKVVEQQVEEFCSAYLKANPKK